MVEATVKQNLPRAPKTGVSNKDLGYMALGIGALWYLTRDEDGGGGGFGFGDFFPGLEFPGINLPDISNVVSNITKPIKDAVDRIDTLTTFDVEPIIEAREISKQKTAYYGGTPTTTVRPFVTDAFKKAFPGWPTMTGLSGRELVMPKPMFLDKTGVGTDAWLKQQGFTKTSTGAFVRKSIPPKYGATSQRFLGRGGITPPRPTPLSFNQLTNIGGNIGTPTTARTPNIGTTNTEGHVGATPGAGRYVGASRTWTPY